MISVFITLILGLVEHYMSTLHVRMELFSAHTVAVSYGCLRKTMISALQLYVNLKRFLLPLLPQVYTTAGSIGSIILKAAGKPTHCVQWGIICVITSSSVPDRLRILSSRHQTTDKISMSLK